MEVFILSPARVEFLVTYMTIFRKIRLGETNDRLNAALVLPNKLKLRPENITLSK